MTIAPPPERKNFDSEKKFKEAKKEWEKFFKKQTNPKVKYTKEVFCDSLFQRVSRDTQRLTGRRLVDFIKDREFDY